MNNPSSWDIPRHVGEYIAHNGRVEHDEGKDQSSTVMYGVAFVECFVFDATTNTTSCAVAILPFVTGAKPCMIRVDTSVLSNPKAISDLLGTRGIIVQNAKHASKYLIASATAVAKFPARQLVKNPGWLPDVGAFFTGTKLITSDEIDADSFWVEVSGAGPMRARGTLEEWREQIGALIVDNPILLWTTCTSIGSLFLGRLNLSSSMSNLCGPKGIGKTIALQAGASIYGNAVDPAQGAQTQDPAYVVRFNGTLNGFEALLGKYSPLPVLLDELTEAGASIVYEVLYMMASGEGKHRMKPGGEAAARERWQSSVIVSAEVSIADTVAAGGKIMHGGQADRAIDIPVGDVGVLTDLGTFDSFDAATRHLKRVSGEQYGTPGEAIIKYCCDNPDIVNDLLAMVEDIEKELAPSDCGGGELRVVKRFAGAVVAGRIAVMAGVFDNDAVEKIDAAFKLVTSLWWEGRSGALVRLRRVLGENWGAVEIGPPRPDCDPFAFMDHNFTYIPINVFNREFGDEGQRILNELAGLSALKTEQKGRYAHRFCNNSIRAYVILTSKLFPDFEKLLAA